jgi:hypothetical protein
MLSQRWCHVEMKAPSGSIGPAPRPYDYEGELFTSVASSDEAGGHLFKPAAALASASAQIADERG